LTDIISSAGFLAAAANRLAVAGSPFGFSILLARLLGPDDMGSVFFALSILWGASLVARLGNDVNLIWSTSRLMHADDYGTGQ
jgi:O-antigen/teichoic acid export membrane protein